MSDAPRNRSEAEETPFTGGGHPFFRGSTEQGLGAPLVALPPKHNLPGSPANYWLLDEAILSNMNWTVTPTDQTVPVFKMPHAVVEGTVQKVITETDGDHHIWLELDGSKYQLACEIAPQNPVKVPTAGAHVRIYGILRYDLQHGWPELHPVDAIESLP